MNHGTKCRCGHLRIHISLRLLRILNQKPKENKETKSFVNTSTSTLRTSLNNILILIKNTRTNVQKCFVTDFKYKDFMPSQAKISLFSKKLSSLTDTQNEIEDTAYRRGVHSAHSAHLGMRWARVAPDGRRPS